MLMNKPNGLKRGVEMSKEQARAHMYDDVPSLGELEIMQGTDYRMNSTETRSSMVVTLYMMHQ